MCLKQSANFQSGGPHMKEKNVSFGLEEIAGEGTIILMMQQKQMQQIRFGAPRWRRRWWRWRWWRWRWRRWRWRQQQPLSRTHLKFTCSPEVRLDWPWRLNRTSMKDGEREDESGWALLLAGASRHELKLVTALIAAIKGYWLSFPPCLGDKVSIIWRCRERVQTSVLGVDPPPRAVHGSDHILATRSRPRRFPPPDNPLYRPGSNAEPSGSGNTHRPPDQRQSGEASYTPRFEVLSVLTT